MTLKINFEKCCFKDCACSSCGCKGSCMGCVEVCPVEALDRKDKLILDESKCIECGACVEACPHKALSLE